MPSKPSDPSIPPERMSTRVKARVSYGGNEPQKSTPFALRPVPSKRRTLVQTLPPATVKQEDEVEEDAEHNSSESDDQDDSTFKSRTRLPASSVQRWKLAELAERIESGWIDLNPEYQRDIVWNARAMSGLINSLIEDYYIPPIIFNLQEEVQPGGTRKHRRVCVDGKQRLSSVHAFLRGEIPCTDRYGKAWYYCVRLDEHGEPVREKQKRRIWTQQLQQEFRNKSFVSYEFKNLTRVQEEDLFARVQKGMPLTSAEKLHAASGPWQDLAKQYEHEFKHVLGLSVSNRSTGFRNILTAFTQIIETQNPSKADGTPQTKVQMPSIQNMCNKHQDWCGDANKAHLHAVFSKFEKLAEMSPKTFQNNNYKVARNFAPVELVAVAVLISEYYDTRNDEMLLGDIEAMRLTIREHLPDLRMDNTTWKTIWQFISELESFRGAADGSSIRKKTFAPLSHMFSAQQLLTRVNASQKMSLRDTVGVRPPSRNNTRPTTASTELSARSTPMFTPGPVPSSNSSPNPTHPGEQNNEARSRSNSVDSVFGENFETPAPGRVQEPGGVMLGPTFAPVATMTGLGDLPYRNNDQLPAVPVVKIESSSLKRPLFAANGGLPPGARALQSKRLRPSRGGLN